MLTVYSKPNCKPCVTLKQWLKIKKIDYKEENINDHIDTLVSKGFMAAPVVKIGDRYLSGVRLDVVSEALQPTQA